MEAVILAVLAEEAPMTIFIAFSVGLVLSQTRSSINIDLAAPGHALGVATVVPSYLSRSTELAISQSGGYHFNSRVQNRTHVAAPIKKKGCNRIRGGVHYTSKTLTTS